MDALMYIGNTRPDRVYRQFTCIKLYSGTELTFNIGPAIGILWHIELHGGRFPMFMPALAVGTVGTSYPIEYYESAGGSNPRQMATLKITRTNSYTTNYTFLFTLGEYYHGYQLYGLVLYPEVQEFSS